MSIGANERTNGRANGLVFTSRLVIILNHSASWGLSFWLQVAVVLTMISFCFGWTVFRWYLDLGQANCAARVIEIFPEFQGSGEVKVKRGEE